MLKAGYWCTSTTGEKDQPHYALLQGYTYPVGEADSSAAQSCVIACHELETSRVRVDWLCVKVKFLRNVSASRLDHAQMI